VGPSLSKVGPQQERTAPRVQANTCATPYLMRPSMIEPSGPDRSPTGGGQWVGFTPRIRARFRISRSVR